MEKVVLETKEETLIFYENNKELLSQLSKEFLQMLSSDSELKSIQYNMGSDRLEGYTLSGGYRRLESTMSPEMREGIRTFEELSSPIRAIVACSQTNSFDSPACSFSITIWDNETPYYNMELVYCENGENAQMWAEITEQIDNSWFLFGHHYGYFILT